MARQHAWVGAAVLELDRRLAETARRAGRLTIVSRLSVEIMDVYCDRCRVTFPADTDCKFGPEHVGGPRKHPDLPAPEGNGTRR